MAISTEQQLDILLNLGKAIAQEKDIERLLPITGDFARDILDADRCSIFILDKQSGELWTKVAQGLENEIRIPANKGVAGFAFLSSEIQIVVDAYNDFRFNKEVDKQTRYNTQSILAVPLVDSKNEVLGVFQALNKKNGVFTNTDAELLLLISSYVSATLENALLFDELKSSRRKLIYKLSTAAEFKDEETSKHTQRVGHYSALIGHHYGLDKETVEKLRLTAPMHDAGKIGIEDAILRKPGKLTDAEFLRMQDHPIIGYELLYDEKDDLLQMAAIIAREHHEKYNGKGYPYGLAGEAISVFARITAIADVFDALTSVRPYKEAWSFEKAAGLLQSERGEHFDAALIDIFISQIGEVREIYESLRD
jgi:HD-GYP domain-containing protein (c-di-GMP phosphodiesterase class II)